MSYKTSSGKNTVNIVLSFVISILVMISTLFLAPTLISIPIPPSINTGALNVITQGNWTQVVSAVVSRQDSMFVITFSNGTSLTLERNNFLKSNLGEIFLNSSNNRDVIEFTKAFVYFYEDNYSGKTTLLIIKAYYTQPNFQVPYEIYSSTQGFSGTEGPFYWTGNSSYWVGYSNQTSNISVLTIVKTVSFNITVYQYLSILQLITTSNNL